MQKKLSTSYNKRTFESKSVKSIGINAVHPTGSCGEGSSVNPSEHLFLAQICKKCAKKSFFINVSKGRVIHVQQYAQKTEDLFDEQNPMHNIEQQGSSIVLFLFHGVGGSMDVWESQIQYFLHEGYEIISMDLLGHGLSSKPNEYKAYEFSELAKDVLYIFDTFCKQKNVLIGHSYGSSFCTLLSKERGHFVSKMVLISGGGPTTLMPDSCSVFSLPLPIFFIIRPTVVRFFRRMAFHVDTCERIRSKITTFGITAYALKAIMQGQLWPEADEEYHADLLVPVLLIYGKGDQFVSLDDEVWMNETIYGSELEVIENAGHMVMIEAPTVVNKALHEFLNRDPSTRSPSTQPASKDSVQDERNPIELNSGDSPIIPDSSLDTALIKNVTNFQSYSSVRSTNGRATSRMSTTSRTSRRKTMF